MGLQLFVLFLAMSRVRANPCRGARLAYVDGGVEGPADIHAEVGAQQVPVTRQCIQLRLAHCRAVAEIVERLVPAKACTAGNFQDKRCVVRLIVIPL